MKDESDDSGETSDTSDSAPAPAPKKAKSDDKGGSKGKATAAGSGKSSNVRKQVNSEGQTVRVWNKEMGPSFLEIWQNSEWRLIKKDFYTFEKLELLNFHTLWIKRNWRDLEKKINKIFQMLELGSNKFVTVGEFRGKKLIQIREYYLDKVRKIIRKWRWAISLRVWWSNLVHFKLTSFAK